MEAAKVLVRHAAGSYPVIVAGDGLAGLGISLRSLIPPGKVFLVTNPVVEALYAEAALESLRRAGFQPHLLLVPDGEPHKHLGTYAALVAALLEGGVERGSPVIALGGGVTGDLVGFAAATVLRGVPVVQVPTTLLAMVDAAVGGKSGVNTPLGKNLVGAFHAPLLVYADLSTLGTLPIEELRSGLGEVVKHALLRDAGLFDRLESASGPPWSPELLAYMVLRSCHIKAEIVSLDEREAGNRAILNYGHTVGHAVETALGHGGLRHGECVAIGIIAEARWAALRGFAPQSVADRAAALFRRLGFPASPLSLDAARLIETAGYDKKRSRGTLRTAIVTPIGSATLRQVGMAEVEAMLHCIPALSEERCLPQ